MSSEPGPDSGVSVVHADDRPPDAIRLDDLAIAWVYRGDSPHPAHAGFAESIGADLVGLDRIRLPKIHESIPEEILNGVFMPDYDVYVVEGTRAMYGMLASQLVRNGTLVYLAGDQAVYKLTEDDYELQSPLNRLISRYGIGTMRRLFTRYVDGVMAVSEFSAEYTQRVIANKPTRVANPYIVSDDLFEALGDVEPSLESNVVVTVGTHSRYKGQDMLVEAWPRVREVHPDAELHLIGSSYPSNYESVPGVTVEGFVETLPPAMAAASLYVQPSRADNFPVSVLEAMRAGLPTVVTSSTGSRSVVGDLSDDLIAEPNPDAIADTIAAYFATPVDKRVELSSTARSIGSGFDKNTRQAHFRQELCGLLQEI